MMECGIEERLAAELRGALVKEISQIDICIIHLFIQIKESTKG